MSMAEAGQTHFLLHAQDGWRAAILDRAVLADGVSTLRLRPLPGAARPLTDAQGSFGALALPTGLSVDRDGCIYILDRLAHVIKRFDPCTETFDILPCTGGKGHAPRQLCEPRGIAISPRGDLYVADTGNHRVQIFALKGLSLRGTLDPVAPAETWTPWDVAVSSQNWVYVSDYANGRIHVFDPWGHWRAAYAGEGAATPPLQKPTHIALDQAGRVYVVQEGQDFVTVLNADGTFLTRIEHPEEAPGLFASLAIAVDVEGNLYISEQTTWRVYVYGQTPDGGHDYAGMCRSFQGMGTALAFDASGNPLIGDALQRVVMRLEAEAALEPEGRYYSDPLDSRIYNVQWHRIVMRALIPPGTYIRIDTLTSPARKTAAEIRNLPDARWDRGHINAQVGEGEWDCLVLSPPGRYLSLRLTLVGDGRATPAVQWIRVEYPRASSLQYLPAVYSEDAESRDFLGRFLSIFDTMQNRIANQIGNIARLFDPAATPSDFLPWLASWLDLTLDQHWPEAKRRQLLQEAHRLYRLRGTPEGLRRHIQIYTGRAPQILEHFKLRRWLFLDHARLGDQSALWGQAIVRRLQLDEQAEIGKFQLINHDDPLRDPFHVHAHQFTVFVPLRQGGSETQQQTLARIVEMAKPAHTQGTVRIVEPRFRVGIQSCIGLDTVIGQYPDPVVTGEGQLGYDTMLGPSADEAAPPTMRVGVRARIGSSTLID